MIYFCNPVLEEAVNEKVQNVIWIDEDLKKYLINAWNLWFLLWETFYQISLETITNFGLILTAW